MPELRLEQLDAHLAKQLAPLYVIHGGEPLLSHEAADAIRKRSRASGFTERTVMVSERGFKWGELHAAGASMSLFGDKKIIELRIPTGKPGTEGAEAIKSYTESLSPDTLTIVSLPKLDRSGQESGWFKALGRVGPVITIYPVDRARLPEWISSRLARQKQRANRETLAFLSDCVEGNLLAAFQEIQKLALLLPEGELDFESVRAAVLNVARFDASQLSEAMIAGDLTRFARVLDGLRAEGEAAPRMVWLVAEELRAVARVQTGLSAGRQLPDLFRENRVWGEPRQRAVAAAARRLPAEALQSALTHTARIERVSKGVAKGDAWDELLGLGLSLGASPASRAASPARTAGPARRA